MSETRPEDAFEILGIEPRFDLDEGALRAAWLRASLEAHPDRAGDRAGDESREMSARLNDAKRVLEDPERRANALLARLGGPAKEEEKGLPDGFLMEIMQLREELEAAQGGGDEGAIAASREAAERERGARMKRVAELFSSGETDADTLRVIRVELNAWRYLERMIEQAEPVERS